MTGALAELPVRLAASLAGETPLFVYRGDSHAWRVRLWADEERTVPFDLTGAYVAAQIRRSPDAREAVDLACEVELPNVVVARLSPERAARCPSGRWDMQVTWPDARVATVVKGPVTVEPDVTRDD